MILKGSQRAGAVQLACHLLNPENEHVEVHDIRGFIADTVLEAFKESQALAMGTCCHQHLFSLSLNPPQMESVSVEVFEKAIADTENRLSLKDQPRIIIFHEKEGRRHAHCVWSRIDSQEMKAIHLPHYKNKLKDISKQLYLENGWTLPDGLRNKDLRNPLNFSREEWQQSKRTGIDPKALKSIFQECWNISDSKKAFANALSEHGLILAKGDRRGFVAVDYRGEVYSIARYVGIKTKEVKAKLSNTESLPTVAEAKQEFSGKISQKLKGFIEQTENELIKTSESLEPKRQKLTKHHQRERQRLKHQQDKRWQTEMQTRAKRLRKGFLGVWDYLTGRHSKIQSQNSMETFWSYQRDQKQRQDLIDQQLRERRVLQRQVQQLRLRHTKTQTRLQRDIAFYMHLGLKAQDQALEQKQPSKRQQQRLSPRM